jgi:hypothetical protein
LAKGDIAFDHSKNCVVFANADIFARVPFGAALTNDDVSRNNMLAAIFFDAKTTARGIATVTT